MKTSKLMMLFFSIAIMTFQGLAQEEGTYYIEVLGRAKPFIPSNINEIVAENRKEKLDTYFYLGTHVRLNILSKEKIEAPEFTKIQNNIVNLPTFN